jgi:hypothetical protein
VIDLRSEEGKALAHELVAGADVFLTNVRQAALEGLPGLISTRNSPYSTAPIGTSHSR